ncbi:MAG: CpaD family pilus assembly protein [Hyphomicrobiaceae bacterium]
MKHSRFAEVLPQAQSSRARLQTTLFRVCVVPVVALSIGLSGCRGDRLDDVTAVELNNPEKRHPIGYSHQRRQLFVEMPPRGRGLSADQHADVYRFISEYKSESNGRLRLSSPASPSGHFSASPSVRQVLSLTRDAGIPDEAIQISRHYEDKGDVGPAIGLSYAKTIAVPPQCGHWPEDIGGENRERLPTENFGCATQRNLALHTANGRDLQFPQELVSRSGERRSKNWGSYIGDAQTGGNSAATGAGGEVSSEGVTTKK